MRLAMGRFNRAVSIPDILFFLTVLGFFYFCLPSTIQHMDTAELVASAYNLNVPHPPGFPLYIWIFHLITNGFPIGTVFWRAAVFTMFFNVGSLIVVYLFIKNRLFLWVCILPLIFSTAFWKTTVLPDVFGLTTFLLSLFAFIYFSKERQPSHFLLLLFLFSLGCLTHPIFVFLLPLLVEAAWSERNRIQSFALCMAGALFVFLGYLSLLLLNTESPFSWGQLTTVPDVIRHALRTEYGVFQLSSSENINTLWTTRVLTLWEVFVGTPVAWAIALIPLVTARIKPPAQNRYYAFLFIIGAYLLVFMVRGNIRSVEMLDRFFILPQILCLYVAATLWKQVFTFFQAPLVKFVITAAACGIAFLNISKNLPYHNYSWNTIVEDYSYNLLSVGKAGQPTAYYVDGDTACYGLRYLQNVMNYHADDYVICSGTAFSPASLAKLRRHWPNFVIADTWNEGEDARDSLKFLVKPNIDKFDFVFAKGGNDPDFHITFLGLGRRLSKGSGFELDNDSVSRLNIRSSAARLPESLKFNDFKMLFSEYSYFYLKAGLYAPIAEIAASAFEKAIEIVPYCFPALQNLCELKSRRGEDVSSCQKNIESLAAREGNYF